jgi:hypothetical protein
MSYEPVTVFDASDTNKTIAADDSRSELAFQDFGNGGTSGKTSTFSLSLRLGLALVALFSLCVLDADAKIHSQGPYDPDAAMRQQIGASSPFSIEYYSKYFDVDTRTVLDRAWRPLNPMTGDYVATVLIGQPDLYGPFWLPYVSQVLSLSFLTTYAMQQRTTLIFTLFLSASISASITAYLAGQPYSYDFTRLTVALSTIYTYALGIPVLLWAVMRYWAGVDDYSAVEVVSIYGYGTGVWIFAAVSVFPRTAGFPVSDPLNLVMTVSLHTAHPDPPRSIHIHFILPVTLFPPPKVRPSRLLCSLRITHS